MGRDHHLEGLAKAIFLCYSIQVIKQPLPAVLKNPILGYFMNKLVNYLQGAREELAKVVWPSRETIVNHTLVVIGISLAVAIVLGIIDYGLAWVLQRVLGY